MKLLSPEDKTINAQKRKSEMKKSWTRFWSQEENLRRKWFGLCFFFSLEEEEEMMKMKYDSVRQLLALLRV